VGRVQQLKMNYWKIINAKIENMIRYPWHTSDGAGDWLVEDQVEATPLEQCLLLSVDEYPVFRSHDTLPCACWLTC
jgi:hypothetical protein